ncbi:MAG: PepSY domain-containing protein [Novosphingobium sp.]
MRKWHRWISVVFGVFLLWISVTGVLSQVGSLVNNGGFEKEERGPKSAGGVIPAAQAHEEPAVAPAKPSFVCPAEMTCRPKPPPRKWDVGLLHHLHSGESFGPVGVVISLLSGVALLFFAFSGLWMYVSMWRGRGRGGKSGVFWD